MFNHPDICYREHRNTRILGSTFLSTQSIFLYPSQLPTTGSSLLPPKSLSIPQFHPYYLIAIEKDPQFHRMRDGAKPGTRKTHTPVTTYNRFQLFRYNQQQRRHTAIWRLHRSRSDRGVLCMCTQEQEGFLHS